jgi:hypothetical protein
MPRVTVYVSVELSREETRMNITGTPEKTRGMIVIPSTFRGSENEGA